MGSLPEVVMGQRRLTAVERRASIISAARPLFAERGFHGVSIDDIVKRLEVSPAVLYQHFPSKEILYETTIRETACSREDYLSAALNGPDDFCSVLRRITLEYARAIKDDPDFLRMEMHAVLEGGRHTPEFFVNRWKTFADYIEYELRDLITARELVELDVRMASLMFQGMIREALIEKCVLQSDRLSDMELEDLIERLLRLFFKAIGF